MVLMDMRFTMVLALALCFCADLPENTHFQIPLLAEPDASSLPGSTGLPDIFVNVGQASVGKPSDLKLQSKLAIVRYVDGEFAKAVESLPGGKKGFKVEVGKPVNDKTLHSALISQGAAVKSGETVQITNIDFREKEIVIDLNGGGKKHFHLLQHLQMGVGADTSAPLPGQDPHNGTGATLVLDYGRKLPDMSPEDLKQQLSALLDFSKHSATVNWIDTLPPQFQQGIKNRQAVVGMDREMVIAALGRPGRKVRERNPQGDETEDWIYGDPPAKTVFVTFEGDKVIRVKEFD